MTDFRASLASFAVIALVSAPAFAFPGGSQGELSIAVDDSGQLVLPAPPKLAAPTPGPDAPRARGGNGNDQISSGFGNDLMRPSPSGPGSLRFQGSPSAKPRALKAK